MPAFKDPTYPVAAIGYESVYFHVIVAEWYVDISGQYHSKFWHYQQRSSTKCGHAEYWRSLYTILYAFCRLFDRSYDEVQFEAIRMINKSLGDWMKCSYRAGSEQYISNSCLLTGCLFKNAVRDSDFKAGVSNLSWQRATALSVGWFAASIYKIRNKCYALTA
jgi:hypothetical protein